MPCHQIGLPGASAGTLEIDRSLTLRQAEELAATKPLRCIQISNAPDASLWRLLDERVFAKRPDVTFRVYGMYKNKGFFNCAPLQQMKHLCKLSIDCLDSVESIHVLGQMPHLRELAVGVWKLENFAFLQEISPEIIALSLNTETKKLDLQQLARFHRLERLTLHGYKTNAQALAQLTHLRQLKLWDVTLEDLSFLYGLPRLEKLHMARGATLNFTGLYGKKSLRELRLYSIRGLADLEVAGQLPGLERLSLECLSHVQQLPDLSALRRLQVLRMEKLKACTRFEAMALAPALRAFQNTGMAATVQPEDFLPVLRNPALEIFCVLFGNKKKNLEMEQLAVSMGKKTDVKSFLAVMDDE